MEDAKKRWALLIILVMVIAIVIFSRGCGNQEVVYEKETPAESERKGASPKAQALPRSVSQVTREWTDLESGQVRKVRQFVELMTNPLIVENGNRAKATVEISAIEGAEIWREGTENWERMSPDEFDAWRRGAQDIHRVSVLLDKVVDPQGIVGVIQQKVSGDGTRGKEAGSRYNETESGINITVELEGDVVKVHWKTARSERKTEEVKLPFSKRFKAGEVKSD